MNKQADSEKLVELLNLVATHGEFNKLNVKQVLQFTRLLNWAQTELLPRLEKNSMEILSVREVQPPPQPAAPAGGKKKG